VKKGIEKVSCPIFLAVGMSDYDCCPWDWEKLTPLPPKMTIRLFEKSGHYPHCEEEERFDEEIEKWAKSNRWEG
jgi:pimeloyl-ACP methyl ester carboxylesterase